MLYSETGEVITELSAIKKEAVSYFQNFLQSQHDSESVSVESLQSLLMYRCSHEEAKTLVAPISQAEIHKVLLSLPNEKVLGPDGFTKEFFVAAWPILRKDFTISVQSFFMFEFLPTGVNSTILSLIPEKTPAQTMKDFRPIACCNLLYKVISKLLSSRLKLILPNAVEPNQSALIRYTPVKLLFSH